jgi:hypothetical protein
VFFFSIFSSFDVFHQRRFYESKAYYVLPKENTTGIKAIHESLGSKTLKNHEIWCCKDFYEQITDWLNQPATSSSFKELSQKQSGLQRYPYVIVQY